MKKILFLLALVLILFSSCSLSEERFFEYDSNPFLKKEIISKAKSDGLISFSLYSDAHYNRDDSNCSWYDEEYKELLREKRYSFAINIGDIADDGIITKEINKKVEEVRDLTEDNFVLVIRGNHDRHNKSPLWDSKNNNIYRSASAYYYGEKDNRPLLSIYNLDTSTKVIGEKQFSYLEEALKEDNAIYKIIVTHENVTTGSAISPSLVLFGLSSRECNKLYKLMSVYNIGLIIAGHNHIGHVSYHLTPTMGEINLAAFHKRKTNPIQYESMGYVYDFTLNSKTGEAIITAIRIENKEKEEKYTFILPQSK